jgi:hypothetical protein
LLWRPADNNTVNKMTQASSAGHIAEDKYRRVINRLDMLETELAQLTTERLQFEERIAQLESLNSPTTTQETHITKTSATDIKPEQIESDTIDLPVQQKLINQGLAVETVNMLQKYIDDKRLQRLNLRDQAIREGWQDSDEYVEKMHALGDAAYGLKQEFGEEVYDQYLYASGRPNRVIVREVINGSVAQSAGLQPGDIITRYADEAIYSMNDLRQATTEGTSGETILLEFIRDKQPYSVTIVRGPLGISMDFARIAP